MSAVGKILMFAPILLVGCRATHDVAATSYHVTRGAAVGSYKVARAVAVGSYRVASAPVHYATRKRGDESSTMVGTDTPPSDVTNPGQSIQPETASAPASFPTGKPVPDKPGYVFSPFDKEGRYVDVSGFPSGTKVKDPWTDKIFLVP
jgi:hypothetical protein